MGFLQGLYGLKERLHLLEKKSGQLIVTDTKELFVDVSDDERLKIGYSTDEIDKMVSDIDSASLNLEWGNIVGEIEDQQDLIDKFNGFINSEQLEEYAQPKGRYADYDDVNAKIQIIDDNISNVIETTENIKDGILNISENLEEHKLDAEAHKAKFNSKFDSVSANILLKNVDYNKDNGVMTFTRYDDTSFSINLPLESIIKEGYFDDSSKEIVLVLLDDSEIRIPASALFDDFEGEDTLTIQVNVSDDNKISANLIGGSITKSFLSTELQTIFDNLPQNRDFLVNPINLSSEVSGKLSADKVDIWGNF